MPRLGLAAEMGTSDHISLVRKLALQEYMKRMVFWITILHRKAKLGRGQPRKWHYKNK